MGGLLSVAPDPTLDVVDEATGLTPREKQEVTVTWALVKKDVKANGETLLVNFFTAYPAHQQLFTAFASVPTAKLPGNKKLQAHATSVMYFLTAVVDNLGDPACLVEMLLKLGRNHARQQVPEQGFQDLKVVLMQLLKDKLGPKLTSQGVIAWDKTLNVAYSVIFKGMSENVTPTAE